MATIAPSPSSARVSGAPTGPGAFIAYPSMVGGYDVAIDRAVDLGLKWIAPRGGDRGRDGNWTTAKAVRAIAKAKSLGIAIYPWVYSRPDAVNAEIEMYRQFLLEGASGIIIDAEDAWKSGTNTELMAQKKALAARFMSDLRRVLPNAFIAHCPYAYPGYHYDFPYVEFGEGCDMVMPQLYWSEFNDAGFLTHFIAATAQWVSFDQNNVSAAKPICFVGNTYGNELKGVLSPPPGEMTLEDFASFAQTCGSRQRCLPFYTLEAAKPEILDFMIKAWKTSSRPPPTHFADLRAIQEELKALGFDPGPVDGIYGSRTRAAVRAFQSEHGLPMDGIVTPLTLEQLVSARESRLARDEYRPEPFVNVDPQYRPDAWHSSDVRTILSDMFREEWANAQQSQVVVGSEVIPSTVARIFGTHHFEQRAQELTAWDRRPFSERPTCAEECTLVK